MTVDLAGLVLEHFGAKIELAGGVIDGVRFSFLKQRLGISCEKDIDQVLEYLRADDTVSNSALVEKLLMAVVLEEEDLAIQYLNLCKHALEFDYELSGVMARKSRHQGKATAVLRVIVKTSLPSHRIKPSSSLVENVKLNDEDLFETPVFDSKQENPKLSELECCVLLANAMFIARFETKDDVQVEKIEAYCQCVLECSQDSTITWMALYLRSLNEMERMKYQRRCSQQLVALCDSLHLIESELFFVLVLPSRRDLFLLTAQSLINVGDYKRAAGIFTSINQMYKAAVCLVNLNDHVGAVDILEKNYTHDKCDFESMCLLGDLTRNQNLFEEAWERSGKQYFPALRALALYHLGAGDLDKACLLADELCRVNPNNPQNWFLLGCCYMQSGKLDLAADAFTRTCTNDPDHTAAWTNLAAIHMSCKNLQSSQHALRQALKLDFEKWELWENMFRVSIQLGDVCECVLAYQRLLELKGKQVGLGPLISIIDYLIDNPSESRPLLKPIEALFSMMEQFFKHEESFDWLRTEFVRITKN